MRRTAVGALDTWARFEAWLADHAPALAGALPDGADDPALARAEKQLRLTLPEDLKAILRRRDGAPGVIGGDDLLSIEQIVATRKARREASAKAGHDPASAAYFGARWLPIVGNGVCLDLDGGMFSGDRSAVAGSFTAWLERIVDDLERGLYPYRDGEFAPWATGFSMSSQDAARHTRILSPGAPQTTFSASASLVLASLVATRAVPADSEMTIAVRAGDQLYRERVAALPHDGTAYQLPVRSYAGSIVTVGLDRPEPGLYLLAFRATPLTGSAAPRDLGAEVGVMTIPRDHWAGMLAAAVHAPAAPDPVLALAALDELARLADTAATRQSLFTVPHALARLLFALHTTRSPEASRVADRVASLAARFVDHPQLEMLADTCVVACLAAPELAVVEHVDAALVSRLPAIASEANARACFNLGCLYARLELPDRALHHLAHALERGMPLDQVRADTDLASLAADPRFLALLDTHTPDAPRHFVLTTDDDRCGELQLADGMVQLPASALLDADSLVTQAADPAHRALVYLRRITRLPDGCFAHPHLALAGVAAWQLLIASGLVIRHRPVLVGPARAGHADVLRYLLDAKASPNLGTPLVLAATEGHEPAARLLVERGAKLPVALAACARTGSLVGVRLLLKLGARTADLEPGVKKHVVNLGTAAMRALLKL